MVFRSVVKSRPFNASPTPPPWTPRRSVGGARKEATERVSLKAPGFETTGWTLNVSRGGLRAILEERLKRGVEYEITLGDAPAPRRAVLVWSQEQADGQIVGLKYTDVDATPPPGDTSAPPREE
jgi:hypothetical protein